MPVEIPSEAKKNGRRIERWFYITAGLFMIMLSGFGFSPTILQQSSRTASPTPMLIAHGALIVAWLLVFLVQVMLVATRRTAIHRRLGIIGPVLAVALILVGYLVLIDFGRRGYDLGGDIVRALRRDFSPLAPAGSPRVDPRVLLFPLSELLEFAILVAAGLWYRYRPEIHKRLMLFALVPLSAEPILHSVGRLSRSWPSLQGMAVTVSLPITLLLLSASAIHDWFSQRRIHPVSLWVPILLFVWQIALGLVIFPSAAWHKFAAWLIL
jgi:hypothetical protein